MINGFPYHTICHSLANLGILHIFIGGLAKEKAMTFNMNEMNTKRELDEATNALHMDIYNKEAQGLVNSLKGKVRSIDKRIAKGTAIRFRVNWKQVGDKCSRQFFQVVRKKNSNLVILGLRNIRGEIVNQREEP